MKAEQDKPRFVADRMLGRLARYLRLLGYDVSYPPSGPDAHLLSLARGEGRVLLTRDRGIAAREGPRSGSPRVVEIRSLDVLEQLAQLAQEGWLAAPRQPRCSICNGTLEAMPEWEARHLLSPYTLSTQGSFFYCGGCNVLLWEGSHWESFSRRATGALKPRR